jgi:hypothetical protein
MLLSVLLMHGFYTDYTVLVTAHSLTIVTFCLIVWQRLIFLSSRIIYANYFGFEKNESEVFWNRSKNVILFAYLKIFIAKDELLKAEIIL